jgi:type II secretory pathway component GspD/PulD (secretin)
LEGSRAGRGDAAGGLYAGDGALPTLPALDGANGRQTRNGRNGGNSGNGADSGADPLLDGLGSTGNTVFGGSGGVTASFAADPRTNSVIVRDAPARMEQYEAIIRRLDQKPRLVELEVNIVEVNADDFSELGIDWRALGRRGSIEVGGGGTANPVTQPPNANPQPNPGNDPIASLGNIAGTVIGVVSGTRNQLFARITALEQAGKATMSAQPKVMTLNNVEAALSATSTFFVPVQGFQDAQLYDISAGTSLRITPSVVAGTTASGAPGRDNVRMRIAIEDGSLTNTKVNQLPVVQNTQVNTQSLVTDGSTLLIAGYAQERESRTQNGVPVLQHVPVLGNLFKSSDRNRTRVERLFMITPRVVDVQVAEAARDVPMLPNVQPVPPAPGAQPAPPPAPRRVEPAAEPAPAPAPAPAPTNSPAPAPPPAPARVVLTTAPPPQPPVAAAAPTAADEQAAARRSAWALGLTAAPPTRSASAPAPAPARAAAASAVPAGNAPAGSLWLTPAPSATKR